MLVHYRDHQYDFRLEFLGPNLALEPVLVPSSYQAGYTARRCVTFTRNRSLYSYGSCNTWLTYGDSSKYSYSRSIHEMILIGSRRKELTFYADPEP
jgi:hypothetical protein